MKKRKNQTKTILIAAGVLLTAGGLSLFAESRGPDFEVRFSRDFPTKLDRGQLDRDLLTYSHWPRWYFELVRAEPLDGAGEVATPGARVRLWLDPKKGPWKKSQLTVEVTAVDAREGLLRMRVMDDSKHRLSTLFSRLDWSVQLHPSPEGKLMILGTATGETRHWRSRLFGRLTPVILMNQVFYPDLLALAGLRESQAENYFVPQ